MTITKNDKGDSPIAVKNIISVSDTAKANKITKASLMISINSVMKYIIPTYYGQAVSLSSTLIPT